MKRIAFIYPILTHYNLPILRNLANKVFLDVFYSPTNSVSGFGDVQPFEHPHISWHPVKEWLLFGSKQFGMYQAGIAYRLLLTRPNAVVLWANPRYLSFWVILVFGYLFQVPIYTRGHGLYKKRKVSFLYRLMYQLIVNLSVKYICYTPIVKQSLLRAGIPADKLAVDYNTLCVESAVPAEEKTGEERGVLFIGRLRPQCDIDVLVTAIEMVRGEYNIDLHVIGSGPLENEVQNMASRLSWIHYHGAVFDQKRISTISRSCRVGCYPGTAGLSVVHLMALSLPVITHSELYAHGPEAIYIQHEKNGFFYGYKRETERLADTIRKVFELPREQTQIMQRNAYKTYHELSTPLYHQRLLDILL